MKDYVAEAEKLLDAAATSTLSESQRQDFVARAQVYANLEQARLYQLNHEEDVAELKTPTAIFESLSPQQKALVEDLVEQASRDVARKTVQMYQRLGMIPQDFHW